MASRILSQAAALLTVDDPTRDVDGELRALLQRFAGKSPLLPPGFAASHPPDKAETDAAAAAAAGAATAATTSGGPGRAAQAAKNKAPVAVPPAAPPSKRVRRDVDKSLAAQNVIKNLKRK